MANHFDVTSTECLPPEEKSKKSRKMLRELIDDHMLKKLGPDRILNYSVHWTPQGKCQRNKGLIR